MEWLIILVVFIGVYIYHSNYENKKTNEVFRVINENIEKRNAEVDKFPNDKNVSKKISFLEDDFYGDRISLNQQVIDKLAKERNLSLIKVRPWIYEEIELIKALINYHPELINEMHLSPWGHNFGKSNKDTFYPHEYYYDICLQKGIPFQSNVFELVYNERLVNLALKIVKNNPDYYHELPDEYKEVQSIIKATKEAIDNLKNEDNKKFYKRSLFFKGKVVAITGTFNHFSEKELIQLVLEHQGKYSKSINNTTDILVAGTNSGNKEQIAVQKEVLIIREADLL